MADSTEGATVLRMFSESASSTAQDQARNGLIDSDVHNNLPSIEVLYPHLSDHWRDYLVERGVGSLEPNYYPAGAPLSARPGAVPPSGGPPGSDLDLPGAASRFVGR